MVSKRYLRAAIDVDDVLMPCVQLAIDMANKKHNYKKLLRIEEVSGWGKTGGRTDVILDYFKDPEFFKKQTVYPEAKNFIHNLSELVEVFLVTAVEPEVMSTRATMLKQLFPEVPVNHIIISSRKDVIDADITLDDNPNHILDSKSSYPVLMRRPWNYYLTGLLAVNTYDEFLKLVKEILNNYSSKTPNVKPRIIALVGPSGSEKNELINSIQDKNIVRVKSYTTKKPKNTKEISFYNVVSEKEFTNMKNKGLFFETSVYAGEHYGTILDDIKKLLENNKDIILPLDITGAIALKSKFSDLCATVYVKKNKRDVIKNILSKPYTDEEKTNRLISLNSEYKNKDICNYVVCNDSIETACQEIRKILSRHKEELYGT